MNYNNTIEYLKSKTNISPTVGVILGSGLGDMVNSIKVETSIPYKEIPGFIPPTIEGHSGNLIFGYIKNTAIIAMQGRNHYYEGYSMKKITYPVRIMGLLGIKTLITSNAVGGLNEKYEVGDIMIVNDHINLMGSNPLLGPNEDEFGVRFLDMSNVYDKKMIKTAKKIALDKNINIHEGILTALSGPMYETPAEYRWLRKIGADCTGMSTIPEVITAHHMGIKCFSLSLVTNTGVPGKIKENSHEEVQREASKASSNMSYIVEQIISNEHSSNNPH